MPVLRALFLLILSVGLFMGGHGLLGTILSIRLNEALSSTVVLGLIQAAYYAGLTTGALTSAIIVRGVGHIRAYAAFAALYAALALSFTFVPESVAWALLRFAQGLCVAGVLLCVESWLAKTGRDDRIGLILAIYTSVSYLGLGLGQLVLMAVDPRAGMILDVAVLLTILAVAPVALTRTREPALPEVSPLSLRATLQASPLGTATIFVSGMLIGALFILTPVSAVSLGLADRDLGIFMAVLIIGGMMLQFPIGRFSDFFDRRLMLATLFFALTATSIAAASAAMGGAAWGGAAWGALGLAAVIAGLSFTFYPIGLAHLLDFVPPEDTVSAAGAAVCAYSVGATVGPIVAASLMDVVGPFGLFGYFAAIGMAMAAISLWRQHAGRPLPQDSGYDYLPLPRTTLVAAVLDPRTEDEQLAFDFDAPADTGEEEPDPGHAWAGAVNPAASPAAID